MTENSGCLLWWPREVKSPFELWGRVGDCSRVTAGQKRPHLGLFPGPKVLFRVKSHLGVAFQTHQGSQASSRVEAKNSALLSSCDGYLLETTEWPKGSQASCGVVFFFFFFLIYFIFKLYIIVLVLPNIKINPPQVYIMKDNCFTDFCCFLWNLNMNQP